MDVDDDDAFLYGAQSPPPAVAPLPALTTRPFLFPSHLQS